DATGDEQTTRIHAVDLRCGRSDPGAKGLDKSRESLLDNRDASALPGGCRPGARTMLPTSPNAPVPAVGRGGRGLFRILRYTWAAPTTLVGMVAGLLTLCTG